MTAPISRGEFVGLFQDNCPPCVATPFSGIGWTREGSVVAKRFRRSRATRFHPSDAPVSNPRPLSHAEKDALIAALTTRLVAADERVAALEARLEELTRPLKTPGNSLKPPSQEQKQGRQAPV
jgi:hypothetical protein